MFDELKAYENSGHFFFTPGAALSKVCNAPERPGIYLIYQLRKGKVDLVYIGAAGSMKQNGSFNKALLHSIICSSANQQMFEAEVTKDGVDGLDIYWYDTFDEVNMEIPAYAQSQLLQQYFDLYDTLPKWNKSM